MDQETMYGIVGIVFQELQNSELFVLTLASGMLCCTARALINRVDSQNLMALRLGCHVTGIDLNPVAWFIVKTEVEPVDIEKLEEAFERLAQRKTASGKSDQLLRRT